MTSFSHVDSKQQPLDHKLVEIFRSIGLDPATHKGVYIEAGANDGLMQSNTALFEKEFGWRGLLVEPSLQAFGKCKLNRSEANAFEQVALISFDSAAKGITSVEGDFASGSCMSSIDGKRLHSHPKTFISVPAVTLQSLLDKHRLPRIDLLSLDTEGYEYEILSGMDLSSKLAPRVCLIELYPDELDKVNELLEPYYECRGNFTNYNKTDNPGWDGRHNDYLFIHRSARD